MATEMNGSKNVDVSVLHQNQFFKWDSFLDKYFKDMPQGFTKYYFFEFTDGIVSMRKLSNLESPEEVAVESDIGLMRSTRN